MSDPSRHGESIVDSVFMRTQSLLVSVLVLVVEFCLLLPASSTETSATPKRKHDAAIRDFKIARPNLVVLGTNLSRVEVWAWATGTGITEPGLVGEAKLITGSDYHQRWIFPIPGASEHPPAFLAVEIFAKGFDSDGKLVGQKSLPYKGATALNEALFGKRK